MTGRLRRRRFLLGLGDFEEDMEDLVDPETWEPIGEWFVQALVDIKNGVANAWDNWGGIYKVAESMGGAYAGAYLWVAETAVKLARGIAEGEPIGDVVPDVMSVQAVSFVRSFQQMAPVFAIVPGVGQGIAIAIHSAAALALGQSLESAVVEGSAYLVPGGPIVQTAYRTAVTMGKEIADGKRFEEGLVAAARANIKAYAGPAAAAAFDAGLALSRGATLREAGFAFLYHFTAGNEIVDRAAHFAEAMVIAAEEGKEVKDVLIEQLGDALLQYGKGVAIGRAREVAIAIVKDRTLLDMPPRELAAKLQIPEEIALAGQAVVTATPEGRYVIDEDVVRKLDPNWALYLKPGDLAREADPRAMFEQLGIEPSVAVGEERGRFDIATHAAEEAEAKRKVEGSSMAPWLFGGGAIAAVTIGWYFGRR